LPNLPPPPPPLRRRVARRAAGAPLGGAAGSPAVEGAPSPLPFPPSPPLPPQLPPIPQPHGASKVPDSEGLLGGGRVPSATRAWSAASVMANQSGSQG
jgi:hypothetical protein